MDQLKEKTFVNEIELDMITVFDRGDIKDLIHMLTSELKANGAKIPYIFLPFRVQNDDKKLSFFLQKVLQNLNNPELVKKIIKRTDCFTLMSALKFLWCRLPDSCVIGWSSYEKFKTLEQKKNYPKNAFLEIMPTCLPSADHASIVYDFLDLLVRVAAYTKENHLSGRKISKLAGIWAFSGMVPKSLKESTNFSLGFDYDGLSNSFIDGLEAWLPASEAMFHLLLAFLRSMLPSDSNAKVKIQRSLQTLLASNPYPPENSLASSHLTSMPLITIYSKKLSLDPVELLARTSKTLSFDKPDYFEAKEDYLVLKYLLQDPDETIIEKLTPESRKIVDKLCTDKKYFMLKNGWFQNQNSEDLGEFNVHKASVSRIAIDDYYIWTWMSSISSESSDQVRKLFGKSLVAEFEFQKNQVKWLIIQECEIDDEEDEDEMHGQADVLYASQASSAVPDSLYSDSIQPSTNIELYNPDARNSHGASTSLRTIKADSPSRPPEVPTKNSPKRASRPPPSNDSPTRSIEENEDYSQGYYHQPHPVRRKPPPSGQQAPLPPPQQQHPQQQPAGQQYRQPAPRGPPPPQQQQEYYYDYNQGDYYYYDQGYYQHPPASAPPQGYASPAPHPVGRYSPTRQGPPPPGAYRGPPPPPPPGAYRGPPPGYRHNPPPGPGYHHPPPAQYTRYGPTAANNPPPASTNQQKQVNTSDAAIANMPTPATSGFNKLHGPTSKPADKKALRSAFVSGDFGI